MFGSIKDQLTQELAEIEAAGLYKSERVIVSAQDAEITLDDGSKVLNFCANNYLGLSAHPEVVRAAKDTLDSHGFGMSSVRFICGTQDIHKKLEQTVTGRQRHVRDIGRIPGRQHQPARFRRGADHRYQISKLVNLGAIRCLPSPPLLAIDRTQITIRIRPVIPDRHTVFLQIADIGVAFDEPQQFMDN